MQALRPARSFLAVLCAFLGVLGGCTTTDHWPDTVRVANDAAIRFEVHGEGEPTLVFVHGWSCQRMFWVEQIQRFEQVRRVVAIDLAGHGESEAKRTDWSMEAFGGDVVAVCDKLELQRIILVGHSMGGPVALEAAKRLGGRVVAIVGVDTFQDVEKHLTPEQIDGFVAPFRADFRTACDAFVRQHLFPPGANPQLVDLVATTMSSRPPEVAIPAMEALLAYDQAANLELVKVPVHCINTAKTDEAAGQRHNQQFSVEMLEGVGHFPMLEVPERFARLLAAFVRPLGGDRS
jgi:pimeloyl-ACP methyl ester carboxylesterase